MKSLSFANLQNVNSDVMNIFYNTKDDNLVGYFNEAPCVCFGIGKYEGDTINVPYFGQVGTTNQFVLTSGYLRFADQFTPVSNGAVQKIFTTFTGGTFTIVVPTSATIYYVCAELAMTTSSSHVADITSSLNLTAKLVGDIDPLTDIVLFNIEENSGTYTVGIDSNTNFNYNYIPNPTQLVASNNAVSGNIPSSLIQASLSGNYTRTVNYSSWGSQGASVVTQMSDGGSGFEANVYILADNGTPADQSGIFCVPGLRPSLMGATPESLSVDQASLVMMLDFATTLAGSGSFKIPNATDPTKPISVQWWSALINVNTEDTYSFPIGFSTACFIVVGSLDSGLVLGDSLGCKAVNAGQYAANATSSGGGPTELAHFIAIGY